MKLIALTGGMGCGKSTAARIFREDGIPCVDADAVCHELYQKGYPPLLKKIHARWGSAVFGPDGLPDRKALADIVFKNKGDLNDLMDILLPIAKQKLNESLNEYRKNGHHLVLLDVPLLYEAGWNDIADAVISIWTPPALRVERMKQKRGWSESEIQRRSSKQMSAEKKLEYADYGIINNGNETFLRKQCNEVRKRIQQKFNIKTP